MSITIGDEAPSMTTIKLWYNEFVRGRTPFKDKPRLDVPDVTMEMNIVAVKNLIMENRRITYKMIGEVLGLSSGTINTIIRNRLNMKKLCSLWVPQPYAGLKRCSR